MFQQLRLENETTFNSRSNSFEYTCISANRTETEYYLELLELQDRVEKYLWTHPQYLDYLRGLNEVTEGGLAEKSGDNYYHHKRRQLKSLLRQFSLMTVSFKF